MTKQRQRHKLFGVCYVQARIIGCLVKSLRTTAVAVDSFQRRNDARAFFFSIFFWGLGTTAAWVALLVLVQHSRNYSGPHLKSLRTEKQLFWFQRRNDEDRAFYFLANRKAVVLVSKENRRRPCFLFPFRWVERQQQHELFVCVLSYTKYFEYFIVQHSGNLFFSFRCVERQRQHELFLCVLSYTEYFEYIIMQHSGSYSGRRLGELANSSSSWLLSPREERRPCLYFL